MGYSLIDEVQDEHNGRPVTLRLQVRQPRDEAGHYTISWRTQYPNGRNRRFYRSASDSCWAIPLALAVGMTGEAAARGWLDGRYDDPFARFDGGHMHVIASAELDPADREQLVREITSATGELDWGRDPLFVIAQEPGGRWRKVMLANVERDLVTFRSCTTDPQGIEMHHETPWRLDNAMMDCSAQAMREFRRWLEGLGRPVPAESGRQQEDMPRSAGKRPAGRVTASGPRPPTGEGPPSPRQYWAFFADPGTYRIEEAVASLDDDAWTTKGKPVRAGDRAIIWKGQGRDDWRGVVALAEVLTDPEPLDDSANPYWIAPPTPGQVEDRVRLRYALPPGLPLRYGGGPGDMLATLSVSRARGGTVFRVTPEQWDAVLAAAGGWPTDAPEVRAAREALAERAGKRPTGQGFHAAPEVRRAVERRAMALAERHYADEGWAVEDVSASRPYDLHCTRPTGEELRVEVKGTTSDGAQILLTPNEVDHARRHHPHVALFIAAGIRVEDVQGEAPRAGGGEVKIIHPWQVADDRLTPLGFAYDARDRESPG